MSLSFFQHGRRRIIFLSGLVLFVVGMAAWLVSQRYREPANAGPVTKATAQLPGSLSAATASAPLSSNSSRQPVSNKMRAARATLPEIPVQPVLARRIETMAQEKQRRLEAGTDGQSKIAPQLMALARQIEAAVSSNMDPQNASIPGVARVDASGAIQVYVRIRGNPAAALAVLQSAGMRTELAVPETGQIQGWIPASGMEALASLEQVRLIQLPGYAHKSIGKVTTEGDAKLKANMVRALSSPGPYTGSGVKVCLISDGCTNRATSVASGDLPASGMTVHPTLHYSGDEGTAMAEIVHDMAPDAQLYAAGPNTSLEMVVAIQWAVNQGCKVICDDLGFWDQPFFEDGPLATAARAAVVNNGVLYVSSAGNSSLDHYQGGYSAASGATSHDFKSDSGEDIGFDIYVPANGWADVYLQWNDAFGQSANDYDLYLTDPDDNESTVDYSENPQYGTDNPVEEMHWQNTTGRDKTMHVSINKYHGAAKTLEMFVSGDAYAIDDDEVAQDCIYGHPAIPEVISVGAIDQSSAGLDTLEDYSSQGPSTISFPSSQLRQTPTITAVDGVSVSGAGGFASSFFGTSAAAPHIAGICALMLNKNIHASVAQIKNALISGAVDKGKAGFDNSFGYGLADALAEVNKLSVPGNVPEIAVKLPSGAGVSDGGTVLFGNVNPGSSSRIVFTVKNEGTADLTGLAVTKDGLNASNFMVEALPATSLAPGASMSFVVVFSPSGSGIRTADIHILSNDNDQTPFDIALQGSRVAYVGSGTTAGRPRWNRPVDNGTAVPVLPLSEVGTDVPYDVFRFTVGASGTYTIKSIASWDNFAVLYSGSFNASTPLVGVKRGNSGFPLWGTSGFTLSLTSGTTYFLVTTGYTNSDSGAYDIEISGPGLVTPAGVPEITVEQPAGSGLTNGVGSINFGTVYLKSSPSTFSFTVKNLGTANLTGLAVTKDGPNAADFTVGKLGTNSLSNGSSTTFDVTFAPSANGIRTAAIHILSNDTDENPFDIHLSGTAATDVTVPVLSVSSPVDATKVVVPGVTFTGTVVELGSKPLVEFSADSGTHWVPATVTSVKSPYSWTCNIPLLAGTNTLQFRATDLTGNISSVVTRTIAYTVPLSTISSPAAGAAVGSAVNVFTGTVPDAGGMSKVEFSIDGGKTWLPATVSGTKVPYSWTANVQIAPGTNTVQFRTIDPLGNISSLVSRTLIFTVPLPVIASPSAGATVGVAANTFKGTVLASGGKPGVEFSTNNGTTWLPATVGGTLSPYTWTANVSFTPGANTLKFRTSDSFSNKSAVVSRTVNYTIPLPIIAAPAAGALLKVAPLTFNGTVVDTEGKPGVEFSADNGANWLPATVGGTKTPYAWTANPSLTPGPNPFLFRTVDVLGQKGASVSRSVTYLLNSTAPLQITSSGNGTFTTGLSGKQLSLNMPYTVTATPGKGMIFKEWLQDGVSFSRNATITFTMKEGRILTPVFIANPYPAVAGTFNGVVGDGLLGTGSPADMQAFFVGNGFITVTPTTTGTFTGTLRLEGQSLPLGGKFDGFGETGLTLKRTGKSNAVVDLKFDTTAPGKITGNVTTGAPLAFTALPGVYTGTKPSIHPLSGNRYTVILPAPDAAFGHGYATLVIAANGAATFAGKLADGTSFTTTSRTVDDGSGNWVVPVHIPLYTGYAGMIFGEVLLPKTGTESSADVISGLGWLRPASTTATMFKSGFLKGLVPAGEKYLLQKDIALFSGNATPANFTLTMDPAGTLLSPSVPSQAGTWPKTNLPVLTKPVVAGMTFYFTGTTGVFTGTFLRTVNGKAVSTPYGGVVLSNPLTVDSTPVRGAGFFSTGTASGTVQVTAP